MKGKRKPRSFILFFFFFLFSFGTFFQAMHKGYDDHCKHAFKHLLNDLVVTIPSISMLGELFELLPSASKYSLVALGKSYTPLETSLA